MERFAAVGQANLVVTQICPFYGETTLLQVDVEKGSVDRMLGARCATHGRRGLEGTDQPQQTVIQFWLVARPRG